MTTTSTPACTCTHHERDHTAAFAACALCLCWSYSFPTSAQFGDWSDQELRASIGARRRLLALGYRSVTQQQRARQVLQALEQQLAERYTTSQ